MLNFGGVDYWIHGLFGPSWWTLTAATRYYTCWHEQQKQLYACWGSAKDVPENSMCYQAAPFTYELILQLDTLDKNCRNFQRLVFDIFPKAGRICLGVSKNTGTPKWMVKIMVPNPMNKWMIWGGFTTPPLFLETATRLVRQSKDRIEIQNWSVQLGDSTPKGWSLEGVDGYARKAEQVRLENRPLFCPKRKGSFPNH